MRELFNLVAWGPASGLLSIAALGAFIVLPGLVLA